jgi:hypothetical protein
MRLQKDRKAPLPCTRQLGPIGGGCIYNNSMLGGSIIAICLLAGAWKDIEDKEVV